jgi:hypothetical protein
MGRHEEQPEPEHKRGFWATFRLLLRQPVSFLLCFFALLLVMAIVTVNVENKYGDWWGAFAGSFGAPLIAGCLLRGRLNRRRK